MRYILILFLLLLCSLLKAQTPVTYQPVVTPTQYGYLKTDSGLALPFRDTGFYRNVHRIGLITARPSDSLVYSWNGKRWAVMGADVATLITLLNGKVDSVTVTGDSLFYWKLGVAYGYILPTAGWKLTGNTVADDHDYIGSNNSAGFHVKTNNTERLTINSGGSVGIGTTSPSKLLDVTSTTSGVLIPRMTTTQRDAIGSALTGEIIYNTSTGVFNYYTGLIWVPIVSGGGAGSGTTNQLAKWTSSSTIGDGTLTDFGGVITGTMLATTGSGIYLSSSALTTGNILRLSNGGTGSDGSSILRAESTGSNSASGKTAYGVNVLVSNSGTSSTNVGLLSTVQSGANNYAIQLVDGSQGNLKVLQSDASGHGTWVSPSSIVSGNTLQQVTTAGNTTTDSVNVIAANNVRLVSLHADNGGGANRDGAIRLNHNFLSRYAILNDAGLILNDGSFQNVINKSASISQNSTMNLPDSSGIATLRAKLNGSYINADSKGTIDLGTVGTSAPNTEIVYGTGSGVGSSNLFTYNTSAKTFIARFTGGTSTLSLDATSGISSIGDATGSANANQLTIDDANNVAYYDNTAHTGKFGINTSSPAVALDVVGNFQSIASTNQILLQNDNLFLGDYNTDIFSGMAFDRVAKTAEISVDGDNSNLVVAAAGVSISTLSGTGTSAVGATSTGVLQRVSAPITVASADSTALSATDTNVTTYTPGSDGSYQILVYSDITAISAATLTITCTYTDTHSNTRTATFFGMGTTAAGLGATGSSNFPPIGLLRVKGGTAITVVATFTGVSITYDVSAKIIAL